MSTPETPEQRMQRFRRDCIDSMVGNTCDNVRDTGNSLAGVTIPEVAAYYLVRASYFEGDLEDVADELTETAERFDPQDYALSPEQFRVAGRWDDEDVKGEVVAALRAMTLPPEVCDVLQQCADTIEGLFDEANPWPEKSELLEKIDRLLEAAGCGGER